MILVGALPQQISNLPSNNRLVGIKIVNNLWSSLCSLAQLNCPGVSVKISFEKNISILLNFVKINCTMSDVERINISR